MCKHYHTHNTSIKHKIFLQWFSIASLPKCFPWPWHILTNTLKRMRGKGKLVWLSPYGALWFWNKSSGYLDSIKQSHVAPMAAGILVHSHPCNECSSLPHAQLMYCSVIGQTEKVQLEWHIDFNTRSLKLSILEMLITFLARVIIITQIHNAAKQAFSDPSTCNTKQKSWTPQGLHFPLCFTEEDATYRTLFRTVYLGLSVLQTPSLIRDWSTGLGEKW